MIKNIVLLSVDDLRFDALSCETNKIYLKKYGLEAFPQTPNIDSFAQAGTMFSQAISVSSYTPSSHASMLTGLYPPKHTIRAFLQNSLPPSILTLSEILKVNGYRTVSAIDMLELFSILGINRGYDASFKSQDKELFQFLGEHKEERIFLFVHFIDVHPPYGESPCPPYKGYNDDIYMEKEALGNKFGIRVELRDRADNIVRDKVIELSNKIRLYCEERAIADVINFPRYLRGVNRFDKARFSCFMNNLKALGILENCLLIITADHGQAHITQNKMANPAIRQKFDHGETVSDELIRVPLIVYYPGQIPSARKIDSQVSQIDVAPTILDYAGISPESYHMQGHSLRHLIEGRVTQIYEAYSEVWYHDRGNLSRYLKLCIEKGKLLPASYETFLYQKSLRTPEYKCIETGSEPTEEDMKAPPTEFVRALYRKVLGQIEDSDDMEDWVSKLDGGALSRQDLLRSFIDRNYNRRALYNLEKDPFEEINLLTLAISLELVSSENNFNQIASELKKKMDNITMNAGIETSAEETHEEGFLEEVKSRLRALGYID